MKKVEHIGIAVKDLASANDLFTRLFNQSHYKQEELVSEGVSTSFFKIGDTKIELLEATDENSPIAKFIDKRGEGIHHIAYEVDDIDAEMQRMQAEGFQLVSQRPKDGVDNKRVCFLHPKTTNGVLIELCQEKEK
ncbi:MAG: methylmalonyl-CoA epimerase [Flavobacteriales bacterium]|nr:methylmalonyl-CoA epimerase [Flavobacteriales bacterium]|tara:strand:+ start:134 stop:538 length:405 start_codon:yes stop_codon:yes gene_type:complete